MFPAEQGLEFTELFHEHDHPSSTKRTISWVVTVYNKTISSQYNLTSQIGQVQDKCNLVCTTCFWNNIHHVTHSRKAGKPNNLKVFGSKKTK